MAKRKQTDPAANRGVYLADETKLNAEAGYANGDLWIWMSDHELSMLQVATIFSDPEKTRIIRYVITDDEIQEWTGFTNMTTLKMDEDGYISVRMRREVSEDV